MDRNRGISRRGLLVGAAAAGALTAPLLRAKPAGASEGGNRMQAVFERYHVGWETRDPDLIASLSSEDTFLWLHDGSEPVKGRDALRRRCVEMFAKFDWTHVTGRILYGENHWTLEWTMVLKLAEPDSTPFTARIETVDVVTVDALGQVATKDVYMNGKQTQAAFARAGIER